MKQSKFYILDFAPMCADFWMEVTEVTEEELIDSLTFNHGVAVDNGDEVPSLESIISELKNSEDYETERLNAFGFLKLTNMSPEEWGYTE